MKKSMYITGLTLLLALPMAVGAAEPAEANTKEWSAVEAKLKENSEQLVVAVNGMCCRNCAIGIGTKVCELDFVDTEALPKGVHVDRKQSLLTVALKDGEALDFESLVKAIRDAGYDPVRIYQRAEDGSLVVTNVDKDS